MSDRVPASILFYGTMNLDGAGMFLGPWLLTRKADREVKL